MTLEQRIYALETAVVHMIQEVDSLDKKVDVLISLYRGLRPLHHEECLNPIVDKDKETIEKEK